MTALLRVADVLRQEGGLLAAELRPDASLAATPTPHGDLASRGPLAAGREDDVAFVVEAVREGHELHYATGRVLAPGDRDLALLAGDRLYAMGLARLAELGDLASIRVLSGVIAGCAAAHAREDAELAEAIWEAGAVAVGWGEAPALADASAAARAQDPAAGELLRAAARQLAGDVAPRS